jgi:hypothetical protein
VTARAEAHGLANQVLVLVAAGSALLASLVARFVLPENFLRDDHSIQVAMVPSKEYLMADSFRGVGAIYRALGLQHAAPLAALLAVGLFVACVFAAVGWERLRDAGLFDLAVLCGSLLIAVVYLGQFSKELVTVAVCALLLLSPRTPRWDVLIVLACVAYGALLRPYWLIVAALYVVWRIVLPRTQRPVLLLLVPVLAYVALQPAFGIALGGGLQSQRDSVNTVRDDPGAVASLITSPLPDSAGPVGILAALLMVQVMICPLPLMAAGSLYHLASGVLIMGIWGIVLVPVARRRLAVPRGETAGREVTTANRAAALLLALLLVQALFEPDFGSYLKHLTPMLPLVLALLPSSLRAAPQPPAHAHPAASDPVAATDPLQPSGNTHRGDSGSIAPDAPLRPVPVLTAAIASPLRASAPQPSQRRNRS